MHVTRPGDLIEAPATRPGYRATDQTGRGPGAGGSGQFPG
jgi:hypothetical protein